MKAAILYGKELVRVEEVPTASLGPGQVRLSIEAALTCGTDLKVFKRGYHAKMIVPPAAFGHELAGTISEIGAGVTGWAVGDRVVVANSAPCDDCYPCLNRQEQLCDNLLFLNGAYAESIIVPSRLVEKNLLRIKPSTHFRDAALMEPLACVVQGVEESKIKAGLRVLILGSGPIGLMFASLSRHIGCEVSIAGRGERRLEAARAIGVAHAIDVTQKHDMVKAVKAADPRPFDVVIEAVGKPEVWQAAVHLVRKGGTVNFFGGCPSGTTVVLDTDLIHYSNLTLLASFHHTPRSIRKALDFIERGVIRADDFVDGECPLSRLPELLRSMSTGNRSVKTLIRVKE
jgi:L-iditol 2-dehydrogenase